MHHPPGRELQPRGHARQDAATGDDIRLASIIALLWRQDNGFLNLLPATWL